MDTVTTIEQLRENVAYLWAAANKPNERLRVEAQKLLRNGSHYVALVDGKSVRFGPSRFIGYRSNTLKRHNRNHFKHGNVTDKAVNEIYGKQCITNPELDKAFLSFLRGIKAKPANKQRKYWWDSSVQQSLAKATNNTIVNDTNINHGGEATCLLPGTEILVTTKQRRNHDRFQRALLLEWDNRCAFSDCNIQSLVQAAHIKPWGACTPHERTDICNGLPLTPTAHALFDRGLVKVSRNGTLTSTSAASKQELCALGIKLGMKIIGYTPQHEAYMKARRKLLDRQ